jgi:hypothetical protein
MNEPTTSSEISGELPEEEGSPPLSVPAPRSAPERMWRFTTAVEAARSLTRS